MGFVSETQSPFVQDLWAGSEYQSAEKENSEILYRQETIQIPLFCCRFQSEWEEMHIFVFACSIYGCFGVSQRGNLVYTRLVANERALSLLGTEEGYPSRHPYTHSRVFGNTVNRNSIENSVQRLTAADGFSVYCLATSWKRLSDNLFNSETHCSSHYVSTFRVSCIQVIIRPQQLLQVFDNGKNFMQFCDGIATVLSLVLDILVFTCQHVFPSLWKS